MGKITQTSSDIIPISDSNSENTTTKSSKMPYMSDNTIVPRVQKYLENNVDKTYVDITQMADELQKKYREYAKRKRSAFRTSVQKAYSIVLRSYGLEDISDDALVSDDSDAESDEAEKTQGGNSLNNTLEDLYQRQPSSSTSNKPKLIESELIDISSEDSEEEAAYNVITTKKSNGAVPSTSAQAANNLVDSEKSYVIDILPSSNKQRNRKRKPDDMLMKVQNSIKKKKINNNNNDGNELIIGKDEKIMRFKNIGGIDKILKDVYKLLLHIRHPEVYKKIGITPPRGILLHGPPGSGKTLLANAIAGELGIQLIKVAAPELVAGVSGESEERIRDLFDRARNSAPCVLFIDEIDTITPNRQNAHKEMERRIVAQILTCLDDLSLAENGDQVLLIGATNRPDAIDPALRRAGRFDREISLGIPDVKARQEILKILTAKLNLALNFDYEKIAKFTPGYVGADLLSLTTEAAMTAVHRLFNALEVQKRSIMEQAAKAARTTVDVNKAEKVAEIAKINKAEENHKEEAKSVSETSNNEEEVDVGTNKSPDEEKIDETVVVLDDTDELPSTTSESAVIPKEIVKDAAAANNEVDIVVEEEEEEEEPRVAVVQEEQEPMPIDEPKPITDVEELEMLQNWFHDQATINDEALKEFNITMEDFGNALKKVQPSAKREGFATVPNTTWDDVGSLKDVRRKLQMAILAPVRHPEQCESLGLIIPTGILLCGPPGCGKTLLAKAIANEAGINFISVKGPELLNMYVGESERAVRTCFERARNSAPCVIFFDELDALCPKRSDSREGGAIMRVVNQMLTEMDGVEGRRGVYLLAASNRPDIIDPAVLRPGRLDKILYVGLPSREDRVDILRAITKNGSQPKMDEDVDLVNIGTSESAKGYTGADLAALVREASVLALEEFMIAGDPNKNLIVSSRHFIAAFEEIRPSVPDKDQKHYEKLRRMYTAVPKEEVEEMEYS